MQYIWRSLESKFYQLTANVLNIKMKFFHADAHDSSFKNLTEEPTIVVTPRDTTQKKNLTTTNVGEECNFSHNTI